MYLVYRLSDIDSFIKDPKSVQPLTEEECKAIVPMLSMQDTLHLFSSTYSEFSDTRSDAVLCLTSKVAKKFMQEYFIVSTEQMDDDPDFLLTLKYDLGLEN